MFLQYVEVCSRADHRRKTAPGGAAPEVGDVYFAVRRGFPGGLSGTPDIAGTVDVGRGEEPRGQHIMWIES